MYCYIGEMTIEIQKAAMCIRYRWYSCMQLAYTEIPIENRIYIIVTESTQIAHSHAQYNEFRFQSPRSIHNFTRVTYCLLPMIMGTIYIHILQRYNVQNNSNGNYIYT